MAQKVMQYSRSTNDVHLDTRTAARALGTLEKDKTSLTIKSSLLRGDKADYFSFKVKGSPDALAIIFKATGNGPRSLVESATISSNDVEHDVGDARVQVLDRQGNVLVDSSVTATFLQKKAYDQLRKGKFSLADGTYTLKVSRSDGVLSSKNVRYAVQLNGGAEHRKSYSTTEYAAPKDYGADEYASPLATALNTLPPDGREMTNIFDFMV